MPSGGKNAQGAFEKKGGFHEIQINSLMNKLILIWTH